MFKDYTICGFLGIFELIIGILIIAAGIYKGSWIGIIGIIPLIAFFKNGIAKKDSCKINFNQKHKPAN